VCKIVLNFYKEGNYHFSYQNRVIYGATPYRSLFIDDHHPQGISKLRERKLDALDEKSRIQNDLDKLGIMS